MAEQSVGKVVDKIVDAKSVSKIIPSLTDLNGNKA